MKTSMKTDSGNEYILTVEDGFTRWAEPIPLKDKRSKQFGKFYLMRISLDMD